jgi:hypothetical protein
MEISTQMDGTIYETTPVGLSNDGLEKLILQKVLDEAVIDLDVLTQMLCEYSWNQIFHGVDQLARTRRSCCAGITTITRCSRSPMLRLRFDKLLEYVGVALTCKAWHGPKTEITAARPGRG